MTRVAEHTECVEMFHCGNVLWADDSGCFAGIDPSNHYLRFAKAPRRGRHSAGGFQPASKINDREVLGNLQKTLCHLFTNNFDTIFGRYSIDTEKSMGFVLDFDSYWKLVRKLSNDFGRSVSFCNFHNSRYITQSWAILFFVAVWHSNFPRP